MNNDETKISTRNYWKIQSNIFEKCGFKLFVFLKISSGWILNFVLSVDSKGPLTLFPLWIEKEMCLSPAFLSTENADTIHHVLQTKGGRLIHAEVNERATELALKILSDSFPKFSFLLEVK